MSLNAHNACRRLLELSCTWVLTLVIFYLIASRGLFEVSCGSFKTSQKTTSVVEPPVGGSIEERLRLPLGGRVTSWDSSGVSVTPVGVESPAGDPTGRRVSALPSGTDPRTVQGAPSQEPAQIGKVKLFPADRGHHIPAPEWEGCRVSSARPAFCFCACWSLLLAEPGSLVAPGCFPSRLRFFRACFLVTS